MVSDQELAEALESLLRQANPSTPFTSLHDVVQQLQSKLGLDLSHKVEFIRNQIHLLFRPQPRLPPPPQQQQKIVHHGVPSPQKDHFALQQSDVFHPAPSAQDFTVHRPEEFAFRPQMSAAPPVTKVESCGSTTSAANAADVVGSAVEQPAETSKEIAQKGKKRRGGPGGLNKLCGVSPLLQAIVGHPALPRTEIVKQLWAYIRKNNLQDPSNKRKIICNDELRLVFETDCTDMFKMNKLLAKHIIPLEPSKQIGQNSKKLKANIESESKSVDSVPIVIISEALASFFGTNEREMSQAEVFRQVWEYIKINQLEDPLNAMVILCDAKLQELLGCESISALGIPEMLARHHLFKRS